MTDCTPREYLPVSVIPSINKCKDAEQRNKSVDLDECTLFALSEDDKGQIRRELVRRDKGKVITDSLHCKCIPKSLNILHSYSSNEPWESDVAGSVPVSVTVPSCMPLSESKIVEPAGSCSRPAWRLSS